MPQVTNEDIVMSTSWVNNSLVSAPTTAVSDTFLEHYHTLGITSTAAMLVVHIMHFQQRHGEEALITADMLAERMGISATAVRQHVRVLEKLRVLTRKPAYDNINRYNVDSLFEKIRGIIDPPKAPSAPSGFAPGVLTMSSAPGQHGVTVAEPLFPFVGTNKLVDDVKSAMGLPGFNGPKRRVEVS